MAAKGAVSTPLWVKEVALSPGQGTLVTKEETGTKRGRERGGGGHGSSQGGHPQAGRRLANGAPRTAPHGPVATETGAWVRSTGHHGGLHSAPRLGLAS